MIAKPILFNTAMVKALLAGRKIQTRRPVKDQDPFDDFEELPPLDAVHQSMFQADYLWVRETFFDAERFLSAPAFQQLNSRFVYKADGTFIGCHKWKPSIHMPRKVSRITLAVKYYNVVRLHKITEADAKQEGAFFVDYGKNKYGNQRPGWHMLPEVVNMGSDHCLNSARWAFANLWNKIYGQTFPWDSNPWVHVCVFDVIHKNIDEVLVASKAA